MALSVIRLNVYCASRTIMHLFRSGGATIHVRATVCKQARSSDWMRGGIQLILGQEVKGQGQLFHCACETFCGHNVDFIFDPIASKFHR